MGADKALLHVSGSPMAASVRAALTAAGATRVLAVGGNGDALAALGFEPVRDDLPGAGPLAAVRTALGAVSGEVAVICACDLPALDTRTVGALLDALEERPGSDVAAAAPRGIVQPVVAAWRVQRSRVVVEGLVDSGERALRTALECLDTVAVHDVDARALQDVDDRADLARYAASRGDDRTRRRREV